MNQQRHLRAAFSCCSSVVDCCQFHFHFQIFARFFFASFTRQHITCIHCVLFSSMVELFPKLFARHEAQRTFWCVRCQLYKQKLLSLCEYSEYEHFESFSVSIKCFFLSFKSCFHSLFVWGMYAKKASSSNNNDRIMQKIPWSKKNPVQKARQVSFKR